MKISSIHQIEITSRCNLRCKYCVHPTMGRPKQDMTRETWVETLTWLRHFIEKGTQGREVNVCGIGESTMHPEFGEWVTELRDVIGRNYFIVLATNGVGLTEDHALAMRYAEMKVWVSLHRPEKAGPAIELLKKYGVLAGTSSDPSLSSVNWAGQVDWHVSTPVREPCPWLKGGQVMVSSTGDILTCCFDGSGTGKIGTITEDMTILSNKPYNLCAACHHEVPA
jgi:hypothetical protein